MRVVLLEDSGGGGRRVSGREHEPSPALPVRLPGTNRRLPVLLILLAATMGFAFYYDTHLPAPNAATAAQAPRPLHEAERPPVPQVRAFALLAEDAEVDRADHRNLFRYVDDLPALAATPPPPPPPPPPEVRPEAQFLGTVDRGELVALFKTRSEILTLREGEVLEQKYLVKRIEPESVLLEDQSFHTTATFSIPRK